MEETDQNAKRCIQFLTDKTDSIKVNIIQTPSPLKNRKRTSSLTDISESENELSSEVFEKQKEMNTEWQICAKHFKYFILISLWLICSYFLMANSVKVEDKHQISIPKHQTHSYIILKRPKDNKVRITIEGALLPKYYANISTNWLTVYVQLIVLKELPRNEKINMENSNILLLQNVSDVWHIPLGNEKLIGMVPEVTYNNVFKLASHKIDNISYHLLQVRFKTSLNQNFPISVGYNLQPINTDDGIIYAAFILLGLYIFIIFEIIHRTLAAMLASTMSVAVLAALNARPTMAEIISWIDIETLLLLFSMMTLVTILSETGVFDYTAVIAYKLTGGKIWPLVNTICLITCILSSFLDNVTTALLITPITIKLCEVMKLNPVPVLMCTIIFDNIGGALTPIGDPPNVILASNKDIIAAGVTFGVFTLHMGFGVLVAGLCVYAQLRFTFRDTSNFKYSEPMEVQELKREIAVWKRTAASMSGYSKDEEIVKETMKKKSVKLEGVLFTLNNNSNLSANYTTNLKDLEKQYPIKDKVLLFKSGVTLLMVICVFFLHSIPAISKLGLGWTALLGALLLLLIYDNDDIEGVFRRVEWTTLLFFACLFILMEALSRLGLIEWIGTQTKLIIMSVGPEYRLTVAIILILWVSGIASAFVDNLPLTTMMVRITTDLASNTELNLPLQPLVWALSFGACFGGNGSLFGSSSNIVCAGVAEQHGYKFTFLEFSRIGVPLSITSLLVVTVYLYVCHVVLEWH